MRHSEKMKPASLMSKTEHPTWGAEASIRQGGNEQKENMSIPEQTGKLLQPKIILIKYNMLDSVGNKKTKMDHFLLFWREEQLHWLLELSNVFLSYCTDP